MGISLSSEGGEKAFAYQRYWIIIRGSVFVVFTLTDLQSLANIIKLLSSLDLALVPHLIEPAEPLAQSWVGAIGDFQVRECKDLLYLVVDGEVSCRNFIGDQIGRLCVVQPLLYCRHDCRLDGVSLVGQCLIHFLFLL